MRNATFLVLVVAIVCAPMAHAGHHRWDISEVYSSPDGSILFVELFSANDNEQNLNGWTLVSNADNFTFVGNLPSTSTANTWVLVGNSGYASLATAGAPAPDYILPDNFFSTAGDTINYASGADSWTFGTVPTDGVNSLNRVGGVAAASPTNFAGETSGLDASISGGAVTVPTLTTWGIVAFIGLILAIGAGVLRRRGEGGAPA